MSRALAVVVVALVNCSFASTAKADIIYTFNTSNPALLAGPVSGSFVVSDSAILDGFISASEIISFNFTLPLATSPFVRATFATPDALSIGSPFAGSIQVNSITGRFLSDARIGITDSTTTEQLGLTTFPGTVPPLVPQYQVIIGTDPLNVSQGSGAWTISRTVPPPIVPQVSPYIFTTIDAPFPGVLGTTSTGINDLGQIVGFYIDSGFATHGYVLSDGNFSTFDFTTADCCTNPSAINNQGQVVGFGGAVSFLFSGGQFSIINIPGSVFTVAHGINNAGQIVGAALGVFGFLGFFVDAGRFSVIRVPGAQGSDARGINDAGQIVGVVDGGFVGVADGGFLFSNGVFSRLDFPGALSTDPNGINNMGTIVGWYQAPDLTVHGFVRDQLGFSTIDFPGSTLTAVGGINNRGEIVGDYNDSRGFRHGFVAKPKAPAFAGTPGRPDCHGESVSTLARRFGGLDAAAAALGFSSVQALQDAIRAFCRG